ncbi:MAG TPA: LacI family DNA-binding transcriptional regulator [Abditibacteriaceae bacterium]|jgi:DNA-binding LacI/PurR family transcriptional regulator
MKIKNEMVSGRSARSGAATLADVAAQAGVSTVAASVVLNRSRTGTRVSAATRERILEAATRLQYRPNAVARSLQKKRTDMIAFYNAQNTVFDPRYPFFAAILAGMQAGCEQHHKDLLIHGRFHASSPDDIFLRLLDGQIDGLILYARTVTPLIEQLVESHLPVVTVAEEVPGVPYVGIDETSGGKFLARHLASKGYRRVLYRSTDEEMLPLTQQERMQAFCEEATALGLTVLHSRSNPSTNLPTAQEREMLLSQDGQRPDAIACWGDVSADGIVQFCLHKGLRIPQDIALAGFDNLPSTRRPALRLTTVRAPWVEVGRTAVGLLAAQCQGEEVPRKTVLPVELVVGDTT